MTKTTTPEPIPIPMAWFVVMSLCVADPEPGEPGVLGAGRNLVGVETGSVVVPEAASVTEAEGETVVAISLWMSPDLNRTAMLFAPTPTPELSVVDCMTSVLPPEIAVTRASTISPSNVVVHPRYAPDVMRPSTVPAHV